MPERSTFYTAPSMFDNLTNRFSDVFRQISGKGKIREQDLDEVLRDVRMALLEADVNVGVVGNLLGRVRERALGSEVQQSLTPGQQVIKIVNEELIRTLGSETVELAKPTKPPLIISMVGLQGSGKTTSAGKLAKQLKEAGKRPVLVAADLQRPAAIEQLIVLGERVGVPVYSEKSSKPARLVKAALKEADRMGYDVVIIDTAGRLQIDKELMDELADVTKVAQPDETLLVVDAMTGQVAVDVAQGFLDKIRVTGIVMSKLDGDARGGAAISVREVTGCPIKFAGVGEGLDQFEVFHPERMASRILGMGDVLTLIEKAETAFDEEEAERTAEKMARNEFDLDDFLDQMSKLRKMGPLKQLLGMIPGASAALAGADVDEADLSRVEAIIRSMTADERRNPDLINKSRKQRIANGSGSTTQAVSALLKQFGQAKQMMSAVMSGGATPSLEALQNPGAFGGGVATKQRPVQTGPVRGQNRVKGKKKKKK